MVPGLIHHAALHHARGYKFLLKFNWINVCICMELIQNFKSWFMLMECLQHQIVLIEVSFFKEEFPSHLVPHESPQIITFCPSYLCYNVTFLTFATKRHSPCRYRVVAPVLRPDPTWSLLANIKRKQVTRCNTFDSNMLTCWVNWCNTSAGINHCYLRLRKAFNHRIQLPFTLLLIFLSGKFFHFHGWIHSFNIL